MNKSTILDPSLYSKALEHSLFFFRSIAQDNIQNIELDRKYETGGTHKAHAEIFIKYNIVY